MEKTMKLTIKLLLVIFIAASVIFAEGEMGNGGRTCTETVCSTPTPAVQNTGESETEDIDGTNSQTIDEDGSEDSILTDIENYLSSLFG
jgi:hypothetical protein